MKSLIYRHTVTSVLALLISSTILVGCGSAVRTTYDLTVANNALVNNNKKSQIQILIADPEAVKTLDGQDIVIRQGSANISYLKGAQWSDRLPNLIQARLVQAFENSGRIAGVGRPGEGLAINYQVLTDIRSFDIIVQGEQKVANVEIAVKLMNDGTGAVRATHIFKNKQPVDISMKNQYALALDVAFREVSSEIVSWVLTKI